MEKRKKKKKKTQKYNFMRFPMDEVELEKKTRKKSKHDELGRLSHGFLFDSHGEH